MFHHNDHFDYSKKNVLVSKGHIAEKKKGRKCGEGIVERVQ
jgi:hypothetical protein